MVRTFRIQQDAEPTLAWWSACVVRILRRRGRDDGGPSNRIVSGGGCGRCRGRSRRAVVVFDDHGRRARPGRRRPRRGNLKHQSEAMQAR